MQACLLLPWSLRRKALRSLAEEARGWLWLLVGALTSFLALSAQFMALERMPVGFFEGLKRGLNLGLSIVVGRLLFKEVVTVRRSWAY